jgi:hypothetical protein
MYSAKVGRRSLFQKEAIVQGSIWQDEPRKRKQEARDFISEVRSWKLALHAHI